MKDSISTSLLERYFKKNTSATEKKQVEEWINASEANKKLAGQIARIYIAGNLLHTSKEINNQKELEIFWSNQKRRKRLHAWRQLSRIAAVLLLPFIVFSIYMISNSKEKETPEELVEVIAPGGTVNSITLPDSSIVYLNSGSVLKYSANFVQNRNVHIEGEAYFIVKKQSGKQFIVNTPIGAQVKVLGTEFNVKSVENQVNTTLIKGSVEFVCLDKNDHKKEIQITPGEQVCYNGGSKTVYLKKVDVDIETKWRNGETVFKDSSLMEVLSILSKRFNTEFIVKNEQLKENRFTGSYRNQSLEELLENLSLSSNIRYKYVNKKATNAGDSEQDIIEIY